MIMKTKIIKITKMTIFLFTLGACFLLLGCSNSKQDDSGIDIVVNKVSFEGNINDDSQAYCVFINEYSELIFFLNENDLKFYWSYDQNKYSEEYFDDNSIIINRYIYNHLGYELVYNLKVDGKNLFLTITAIEEKKGNYAQAIDEGFRIMEIKKSDIVGIESFNYEINYERR